MLRELYIKNMILIDELRLQFGEGLNVLTGETGAGKSIIVDCLELLMGERINSDMIRDKLEKSRVEGVVELPPDSPVRLFLREQELSEEDDGLLIIRREITSAGKTVNRVNGRAVNASVLKNLAEYLVDIHLQHDNQQVLNPRFHLHFLDSLSPGIKQRTLRLAGVYQEWKSAARELEELRSDVDRRAKDLEFIEYQIGEIEAAQLLEDEDEELLRERGRILNREKASEVLAAIERLVFGENDSALSLLARAREVLRGTEEDVFIEIASVFDEAYYSLEDAGQKAARFRDQQEYDPGRLEIIEERLQVINRLKRKYGGTIAGVGEALAGLQGQKSSLQSLEVRTQDMEDRIKLLWAEYEELALEISDLRQQAARQLEARIREELAQLSMPGVTFSIELNPASPAASGIDEAVFLFSANPGEMPRPIARIASGGEASRFILALKTALAEAYQVPILIFDEIDVGVGGQALLAMGAKIHELSRNHQVILVTHSPQIAALAHTHLQLQKEYDSGLTRIAASVLEGEGRVDELSRMLAGDHADTTAREHAKQLLRTASNSR